MKFKEQWIQVDEVCPHCHNITKRAKGLTKQNLKRLCSSKPTAQDWMMLFIWISALIIAFSYNTEVAQCQDVIINFDELCTTYKSPPASPDYLSDTYNTLPENFTLTIVYETQER